MKVKVYPSQLKERIIQVPPSKSMAHRAIICASLAQGKSRISNVDYSVDIVSTIEAMRSLGARIDVHGDVVEIQGINCIEQNKPLQVVCNESGSTLRFLIPLFSLTKTQTTFRGSSRLMERPLDIYKKFFDQQGLQFSQENGQLITSGSLQAQTYEMNGNVSSQFISGLCFALPLLKQDSVIKIIPPFESRSYVDLTIEMMKSFGVVVEFKDETTLVIPGNQTYSASDYRVEGDYSQCGFYAVLGALQGPLDCVGLKSDSQQGDRQIISMLKNMGCNIEQVEDGYRFYQSQLHATTVDLHNCPDLGPIVAVAASFATGKTHIVNAGRLRLKESDRIASMQCELSKVGAVVHSTNETMEILGPVHWESEVCLYGHNDHRIVMALAIGATMANKPIIIDDAQAINKSYPRFFDDLSQLGIQLEFLDD